MSVICLDWESAHAHGSAWISQHRFRYDVFVDRMGWNLPHFNGLEFDQFDTPAAKYIVCLDEDGTVRGVTRLLPTTLPYMLRELWPELAGRFEEGERIWEATRFGVDRSIGRIAHLRVVHELIAACQEFGLCNGIEHYLCVMPVAILRRVIERSGCATEPLGPPVTVGRHRVVAAKIEISRQALERVKQSGGIRLPVLRDSHPKVPKLRSTVGETLVFE
jgi:N-acyl-L-homoserine lactone synthetase